jgi:hypothetical protein
MRRCWIAAGLLAELATGHVAAGQCNVQSAVTQPSGVNTTCFNFVGTTLSASLPLPCRLEVQATAAYVAPFQPTFAILVLGDTPTNTPLPSNPGCPLFTNPLASLWQQYANSQAVFTFAIPPLVLPLRIYAQAATISWVPTSGCPRGGCGYYVATTSDGIQITLQ